jgi:hypothetical protein
MELVAVFVMLRNLGLVQLYRLFAHVWIGILIMEWNYVWLVEPRVLLASQQRNA